MKYDLCDDDTSWVGFGVPDWESTHRYNGSTREFYGLWAYCQNQLPLYNTVCQKWPSAEKILFNGSRPQFVRSADGLVTTGMILLTFGLIAAVISALLPLLIFAGAILAFLSFLFLVIGLPIFARSANNLSKNRGDAQWNHLYGLWLIVPTIILEFLAGILWALTGFVYRKSGYGNIGTRAIARPRVIQKPAQNGTNNLAMYRGAGAPFLTGGYGRPLYVAGGPFLNNGSYQLPYAPLQNTSVSQGSLLPQPSIARANYRPAIQTTTPAYIRPYVRPYVNLSGRPVVTPARSNYAVPGSIP
ncbi:unnamed protein product [Didymodactylos carnosus]|uniref:Uncharacterized protein n=1 Tax=Didymodactylos carnosus TaxID=1234261 RepID=A0A814Q9J5_9BILA|nr:unnamed protein product [Didymodactylos carnosus]CAF1116803.1 unnamed protein product [Didymodactylos carnosus]CAF3701775.1 unnamed protein product [Didymodactylos carnosus]CAF3880635.1 unnamed protein product [Didymodactylos carnosus]